MWLLFHKKRGQLPRFHLVLMPTMFLGVMWLRGCAELLLNPVAAAAIGASVAAYAMYYTLSDVGGSRVRRFLFGLGSVAVAAAFGICVDPVKYLGTMATIFMCWSVWQGMQRQVFRNEETIAKGDGASIAAEQRGRTLTGLSNAMLDCAYFSIGFGFGSLDGVGLLTTLGPAVVLVYYGFRLWYQADKGEGRPWLVVVAIRELAEELSYSFAPRVIRMSPALVLNVAVSTFLMLALPLFQTFANERFFGVVEQRVSGTTMGSQIDVHGPPPPVT
jgi:hypothetical protein